MTKVFIPRDSAARSVGADEVAAEIAKLPGVEIVRNGSRGLLWLQRRTAETLDDAALQDYLRESHRLAALNLSKRLQRELGLID